MAYSRKGGNARTSTLDDFRSAAAEAPSAITPPPPSSIAARAIRDSSAHGDSSLSSVYGQSAIASANRESNRQKTANTGQDSTSHEYTSMNSLNESKNGFWGVIARKAKAFLDDDHLVQKLGAYEREYPKMVDEKSVRQARITRLPHFSSLTNEVLAQKWRKLEDSLVANAMAAKAKLLMREVKTVMADLAFSKERCSQLEEENTVLKGSTPEDDDLIWLWLETLLRREDWLMRTRSMHERTGSQGRLLNTTSSPCRMLFTWMNGPRKSPKSGPFRPAQLRLLPRRDARLQNSPSPSPRFSNGV